MILLLSAVARHVMGPFEVAPKTVMPNADTATVPALLLCILAAPPSQSSYPRQQLMTLASTLTS